MKNQFIPGSNKRDPQRAALQMRRKPENTGLRPRTRINGGTIKYDGTSSTPPRNIYLYITKVNILHTHISCHDCSLKGRNSQIRIRRQIGRVQSNSVVDHAD